MSSSLPTHVRSSVAVDEKLAKTSAAIIGPTAPAVASKEMVTMAANNMMHTTPAAANAATEEVIGGLRFLLDSSRTGPPFPTFPTSGSGGSSKGAASSLIFKNDDYCPRPPVHAHCTVARVTTGTSCPWSVCRLGNPGRSGGWCCIFFHTSTVAEYPVYRDTLLPWRLALARQVARRNW